MKEIVIYTQPGIDLDISGNEFTSDESLDVSSLNKGLSKYELSLSKLSSHGEQDQFNRGRPQHIFILSTSDDAAAAILEFLSSQNQFIQSAYIKTRAEDPMDE